MLNCISALN
jgi:uncharacterized membrane protein